MPQVLDSKTTVEITVTGESDRDSWVHNCWANSFSTPASQAVAPLNNSGGLVLHPGGGGIQGPVGGHVGEGAMGL